MSLFCFLWPLLLYLFWLSISPDRDKSPSGRLWALVLGSVPALLQYFHGPFIEAEGFGFSRWLGILVDLLAFSAALPPLYVLFVLPRRSSPLGDITAFALLAIIPQGIAGMVAWSANRAPWSLILLPLLWTALALGMSFFLRLMLRGQGRFIVLAVLGALALPPLAATSYWAFFSHRVFQGALLCALTCVPMAIHTGIAYYRKSNGNEL